MMGAAAGGHADVCRALCRAGAKVDLKNTSGQTAGDLAKLYGFADVTEALVPYSDRDGAGVPRQALSAPSTQRLSSLCADVPHA